MSKKILAAGIVRDIEFSDQESAQRYLSLYARGAYQVLNWVDYPDGSCIVRVVLQYNNSPLIPLISEVHP